MDSIIASLYDVQLYAPTTGCIVALCTALFLLFCSGFVSASEIAFFSLTPKDLQKLEDERDSTNQKIMRLRDNSERLLATILISNNLVNVGVIMLVNYFVINTINFGSAQWLEFLIVTVVVTFLLLLFGEIMPKIYSSQKPLSFCRKAAPVFDVLQKVFYPLSSFLIRSKGLTDKIIRHEVEALTADDLEQALELTDKEEIAKESSMLEGIIRFSGESVRDIMTPRVDMVDVDIKMRFPDVLKCIVENNYSRIPVYSETEDNIKGVLYIKDLLPHLGKPANFRWQSLIRPPYFVPETKMIDDLLRVFQTNKVHIAIVVDEFGGTSGIVTMEDILEEIVGEINDEYDETEKNFVRMNRNTYLFEGKCMLVDLIRTLHIDEDFFQDVEGEADTLAGLLLEITGEFPKPNDKITYRHLTFEVVEVDERRIIKIKVIVGKA